MKQLFQRATAPSALRERDQRIAELEAETERLRKELERIRGAMRHCTTCDYRLQVLGERKGSKLEALKRRGQEDGVKPGTESDTRPDGTGDPTDGSGEPA